MSALHRALDAAEVRGPIILVAHSYGGWIASLFAESDPRVVGMVLVEALLPDAMDDNTIGYILATDRPQYKELRQKAPRLAQRMSPMMEAYPQSAKRLRQVEIREALPVIDIVAQTPWGGYPGATTKLAGSAS